jgi:hypothetical protein
VEKPIFYITVTAKKASVASWLAKSPNEKIQVGTPP